MHLCEYLANAAPNCTDNTAFWLDEQKQRLKTNQANLVLGTLLPFLEPSETSEEKASVREAYRYLRNRLDQVEYQGAIEKGLPIGSGEIESAHHFVVQSRLKRSGAWWSPNNIDYMLALYVYVESTNDGTIIGKVLGNSQSITHPSCLSFCPSSALQLRLHSLLCALKTNKNSAQYGWVIDCELP